MIKQNWQITEPFDAVLFDCDGTLCAIEGIDYLAELRGVYDQVANLTREAMGKSGLTPALYEQRLNLVQPTRADVLQLGEAYCQHLMPDIRHIITVLQKLNKSIYILSAGLKPAVSMVAEHLTIPVTHVKAVDIHFDHNNTYLNFDVESPLVYNQGKQSFVKDIQKNHSRILYIGDGLNDLAVKDHVTRFVGYGGAFYRSQIAQKSDFYITDFSALLPLALTKNESEILEPSLSVVYQKGLNLLQTTVI